MRKQRKRTQEPHETEDAFWAVADTIARLTAANPDGSLRLDKNALDESERGEVVLLTWRSFDDYGSFKPAERLGPELERWEALIEKGCGRPNFFQQAREEAQLAAGFAEIAQIARMPRRRIDLHEEGSVTLKKQWVFDWFNRPDPVLWLSQVGLLVFLMAQFENGASLTYNGRIEGDGDDATLVIDLRTGIGSHLDDDDALVAWQRNLEHLAANQFVTVERSGPTLFVKRGLRLRNATRRAAA